MAKFFGKCADTLYMLKWFIYHEEVVSGPFSVEKVKEMSHKGQVCPDFLIWSCAQSQWSTLAQWERELPRILKDYENTINKYLQNWYYTYEGEVHGPFPKKQLIEKILKIKKKKKVSLWTKGMSSWLNIFEFKDILSEVGINRRAHPRVDIDGTAIIKVEGQTHLAQLRTISAGGCGLTQATNLSIGQRIHIEIQSEQFITPLKAIGEVRYISKNGFVGIKFEQIPMESKSAIIEYIKNLDLREAS